MFGSRYRVLVLGAISGLIWICSVQAEPQDPKLPPTFGAKSLDAGFLPDPYKVDVVAGGEVDTKVGGFPHRVGKAPDFRLTYKAGAFPLIIHAESAGDATLLIHLPDGTWIANDDREPGNLNPMVKFDKPQSGVYDIFVGSLLPQNEKATLFITEMPVGKGAGKIDDKGKGSVIPPPAKANAPDPTLPPTFGTIKLNAGFDPDPHSVKVVAGGPLKVKNGDLEHYVAAPPDYKLDYTAGKFVLTIHVESAADTTLLIRTPDGKWLWDDDSGGGANGVNPQIRFNPPVSGVYDIYVGTFAPDAAPAMLHITEKK